MLYLQLLKLTNGKMEYKFGSILNGKSFSLMIQLKQNLEKGFRCAVATQSPGKTKRDFGYMTGATLQLNEMSCKKGVYIATIAKK